MKQIVKTTDELSDLIESLNLPGNAVSIRELDDNAGYEVQCIERKKYIDDAGEEQLDEVWLTEDNRMMLVQDIEHDHCKNIIRMMLRQHREQEQALRELQHLVQSADSEDDGTYDSLFGANETPRVLH